MIPIHYNGESDKELYDFCTELQKYIGRWLQRGYIGSSVCYESMDEHARQFFTDLNSIDSVWKLVNMDACQIIPFIEKMEQKYPELANDRKGKSRNPNYNTSRLYKCIEKALSNYGYDSEKFPSDSIFMDLGLVVCPYCNRNFIQHIKVGRNRNGKVISVKGQIDHFYPRSLYPYLAITRRNLVPSCPTCNGSSGKHDIDTRKEDMVNPYLLKDSRGLRFKMKIVNSKFFDLNSCAKGTEIIFDTSNNSQLENNIKVFHLEKLYETHRDYPAEIYFKRILKNNNIYMGITKNILKAKGITLSKEDINRIQLGVYTKEDDLHRRPLSKLISDLADQFGLLYK